MIKEEGKRWISIRFSSLFFFFMNKEQKKKILKEKTKYYRRKLNENDDQSFCLVKKKAIINVWHSGQLGDSMMIRVIKIGYHDDNEQEKE